MELPRSSALQKHSLRGEALRVIRGAIIAGDIPPGQIYSAPALAAELNVSATPVREAMLDLVAEGLVEPVRNRGFRVVELTPHDIKEILQLWRIVEPELTATVAGRLSDAEVERLQSMVDAIVGSAGAGDIPAFIENDRAFHEELLSHAGNGRALELVSRLRDQGRRYGLLDPGDKGAMAREVAADHQAILDAVVAGDAAKVRRLLTDHINRGLVFVERSESAG